MNSILLPRWGGRRRARFRKRWQGAVGFGSLACLMLAVAARAALPSAGASEPFRDGDIVCFAGDSITHTGSFPSLVALFYATRFPERRLRFENAGISGDRASAIVADDAFRLEKDILGRKATVTAVMLGMNDIDRSQYGGVGPDVAAREARDRALAQYATAMTRLLDRVQAAGSRLILLTPTPYDDTAVAPQGRAEFMSSGRRNAVGANAALATCAELLRGWARERQAGLVDLHAVMTALNQRGQRQDPNFTVVSEDRIHPGAVGHFVMMYAFLKAQGLEGRVAEIVVAAHSGDASQSRGCEVADFRATADGLRFTVHGSRLPFPVPVAAEPALALVPFTEEFNQAPLRIGGLRAGRYRLAIDEVPVGEFTDDELARGVDLASLPGAPQTQQAAEAGRIAAEWMLVVMKQRDAASVFYQAAQAGVAVDDAAALAAYVVQRKARALEPGQKADRRFERFQEELAQPGRFEREAAGLYESLRQACQPRDHRFALTAL